MAKLVTTDISNLSGNPGSAETNINANNASIEVAMENTLSRDGTTPNTMSTNLDMNSNKVVNVASPTSGGDVVNKTYADAVITSGLPPQAGNSGKLLTTDGTDASWGDGLSTFVTSSIGFPLLGVTSIYDVDSNLASATWESIGPTGSGADNVYAGLDSIPLGVDWVEVNIHIDCVTTGGTPEAYHSLLMNAIANGGTENLGQTTRIQYIGGYVNAAGNLRGQLIANGIKIPVDSAVVFKLRHYSTYNTAAIALAPIGYGYNQ